MTAPWKQKKLCEHCGRSVSTDSDFGRWIRENPELDSRKYSLTLTDLDWVIHRFRTFENGRDVQYMMYAEVKTLGAKLLASQRDTLGMVHHISSTVPPKTQRADGGKWAGGHDQNIRLVWSKINGKKILLQHFGVHTLSLSGTTPENSESIVWDGKHNLSLEQFVKVWRLDLNPNTLRLIDGRRHKKAKPKGLFEGVV